MIPKPTAKVGSDLSLLHKAWVQPNFHRAYLTAARKLLSGFEDKMTWRNEDGLPIFFLQRHALELLNKDCLRIVYQLMIARHELDNTIPRPCDCKIKRVCSQHNIHELYRDLKEHLVFDSDSGSEPIARLGTLVHTFHSLDKKSTWARYPNVNMESCSIDFIEAVELDICRYQDELESLSRHLLGDDSNFMESMFYKYSQALDSCLLELDEAE